VRASAEKAGRDPSAIEAALFAIRCRVGPEEKAKDGRRLAFTGSRDAVLDDIAAYRKLGLKHLVIGAESNELSQVLDRIEAFAGNVMARVS
jgi:hypothetical protein